MGICMTNGMLAMAVACVPRNECGQFPMDMAAKSVGGYRESTTHVYTHSTVCKMFLIMNNTVNSTGVDGALLVSFIVLPFTAGVYM